MSKKDDTHSDKYFEGLLSQGEAMRRQVLGNAHVDKSLASADEFNRPMQEMITAFAWGDVWNREGLSLKTRSMLNIAMLTALCHHNELGVHVKGAINNGCSPEEIREAIIHASVYAGAPAGLSAMRVATSVLKEMGEI